MISLQNIVKTYPNGIGNDTRNVLNGISLEIHQGDAIAITGPSGSGKSTLLNIIGTLDSPTSGKVYYDQSDVTELKDREMARLRNRKIGFVFQRHYLLPQLTLLENILVPLIPVNDNKLKKDAHATALDLLRYFGLEEKETQYPGNLSVGECQRGAMIRALINRPEILLADEPTGALDKDSADRMGEMLLELNKTMQVAIVLVTHSIVLAKSLKTQYSLMNGKLKAHSSVNLHPTDL